MLRRQRKAIKSKALCYRWLGGHIQGALHIFKNKPPPQSRPCLLLKKGGGLFSGGYGIGMNIDSEVLINRPCSTIDNIRDIRTQDWKHCADDVCDAITED